MNRQTSALTPVFILILALGLLPVRVAAVDTRYDAGLNLPFNEKAGDLNPQTGNLTLQYTDLELPGRGGLHFRFGRIWALNQSNLYTMYRDPVDGSNKLNADTVEKQNRLGAGWSTNLPYVYGDSSSGQLVINLFLGGNVYEVDWTGAQAKDPARSNLVGYDLSDLRIYADKSLDYTSYSGTGEKSFDILVTKYGLSDTVQDRSAFVLLLKNNDKYWFRQDGKVLMQEDKTGLNRIWYFYRDGTTNTANLPPLDGKGKLALVADTIGREIQFLYDSSGNLSGIEWDVTAGTRLADSTRKFLTEKRRITYGYASPEENPTRYPGSNSLKTNVTGYRQPFLLTTFTDPLGNVVRYDYEEGRVLFTYNKKIGLSQNIYMKLVCITEMYVSDEIFKSKRCFDYAVPAKGMFTKYFYEGFMEYFKLTREYFVNRHNRIMNDTTCKYYDRNEAGNYNQYSTVITRGKVKTTYRYLLENSRKTDNVLASLLTETEDGFRQLTEYAYDDNRAKVLEQVFRNGTFVYEELFEYDKKANLRRLLDKRGLLTQTEYDEIYSIPIVQKQHFTIQGQEKTCEKQTTVNHLGQVINEIQFQEQENGESKPVVTATYTYDAYGNITEKKDAKGSLISTVYDAVNHIFPVKTCQDVQLAAWTNGGTVHTNWRTDPDGTSVVRIRNWKVYNSDGSVWLEVDNEGHAIEHYYDRAGSEVERVNPDANDERGFAQPVKIVNGLPAGEDFDDFTQCAGFNAFLASRTDNPGVRIVIDYTEESSRTFTDLAKSTGAIKVTGIRKDGLGNTEEELEYADKTGTIVFAKKWMEFDDLGRMIGLTDPDADTSRFVYMNVNGRSLKCYDKTWIVVYDDLGRKKKVYYPATGTGQRECKLLQYDDIHNSLLMIDPEGRKLYERRDWNGNLVEMTGYGDSTSLEKDALKYSYEFDALNRKISFTDPQGIITLYRYNERNLLVEQIYGDDTGSDRMKYNELGQLTEKLDRKKNKLVFVYDAMGRNIRVEHFAYMRDEEMYTGTGKTAYNHVLQYAVQTAYDNRGNAVRISNQNLIEHYMYDYANRVICLDRIIKVPGLMEKLAPLCPWLPAGHEFSFAYTYNDAGLVTEMVYPNGYKHLFAYDTTLGRLTALAEGQASPGMPFVQGIFYNKAGVVTGMDYANGTSQLWEFDNRKRISHIRVNKGSEPVEALSYTVNSVGNIVRINNHEYTYDPFNRLTGAKTALPGRIDKLKLVQEHFGAYRAVNNLENVLYTELADLNTDGRINGLDHRLALNDNPGAAYDQENFTYDKNGNRTSLVRNADEYLYEYGKQNRLEKIWLNLPQQEGTGSEKVLYIGNDYDANGNTTKQTVYAADGKIAETTEFFFDTLNRLVKSKKGPAETVYYYDNSGNRFVKQDGRTTTLYLRHGELAVAMDIEIPGDVSPEKARLNRYLLSGDLLAGRVTTSLKADNTTEEKRYYYHLDHLNSTKCVTDELGKIEVRYEYRAFGEQLQRLDSDNQPAGDKAKYSYNGKELDDETNLFYYNARYYDATTGRFINVDPIQSGTNHYIYCNNNPLSFKDPSGLSAETNQNRIAKDATKYTDLVSDSIEFVNEIKHIKETPFLKSFGLFTNSASVLSGVSSLKDTYNEKGFNWKDYTYSDWENLGSLFLTGMEFVKFIPNVKYISVSFQVGYAAGELIYTMADKLGAWDWLGEKYFQYFGLDPDVHDPDYFNNSSPSKIAPINDNPFGLKDYDEIPYETIRSDSDYDESNLLPPSHGMYNE